jgi:hypothetical protein
MIGGTWDGGDILNQFGDTLKSDLKLLAFKVLWRSGYTRCPSSCDISSSDSCACAVPDEYLNTYGAIEILNKTNILWTYEFEGLIDEVYGYDDNWYLEFLKGLEHPGIAGEMFASNAPYDPTFWPIHGSTDRLLSLKRILFSQGDVEFDETWGFEKYSKDKGALFLDGVCDWSAVTSVDDLTLPTCNTTASCYGHGESDVMDFSNFLGENETYTNLEFYEFMHPWTETLPYVYDTYEYTYCDTYGGIDFLDGIEVETGFEYKGVHKEYLASHPHLLKNRKPTQRQNYKERRN